jgi:hypothetical protein
MIAAGTHNFLGGKIQKDRVISGKHHFLGPGVNNKRVQEGIHPFQKREDGSSYQLDRVASGEHNLLGDGSFQRQVQHELVKTGRHNFTGSANNRRRLANGNHPSQIMKYCEHCRETVNSMTYGRLHGDKCRSKTNRDC